MSHYDKAEELLARGDAGSMFAALIHAVLAVAEEFKAPDQDDDCGYSDVPLAGLHWPEVPDTGGAVR